MIIIQIAVFLQKPNGLSSAYFAETFVPVYKDLTVTQRSRIQS